MSIRNLIVAMATFVGIVVSSGCTLAEIQEKEPEASPPSFSGQRTKGDVLVVSGTETTAQIIPSDTVTEYSSFDVSEFDRFDIYDAGEPSSSRSYEHSYVVSKYTTYETPSGLTNEFELFQVFADDYRLDMRPTSGYVPEHELARMRNQTVGIDLSGVYGELFDNPHGDVSIDVTLGGTWIRIIALSRERAEEIFYQLQKIN